ncbi:MAG: sensor histidine kinase [Burkholderiales bacterium]|nr:sensor histidine kinase [Burkholderiales bacterium]
MSLPARLRESLRVRLLAGTLIWILASIAVAGWGLDALIRDHVERQFLAELRTHLDQLTANLVVGKDGAPELSTPLTDPRFSRPYSGLYWQVDRVAGSTASAAPGLLRSRSLWDYILDVPHGTVPDGELHQHRVPGPQGTRLTAIERSIYPAQQPDQAIRLIVAADEAGMIVPMQRFRGMLWVALGLLATGLVAAAVMQVVIGLAPLARVRRELTAVREGKAQLMAGPFPAEVKPLVDEFNVVLGQNAEVVERARTLAGNLAHALKTPLSVLANAARAEGDGEFAQLVGDQIEIARRQVDYHLRRARSAAATRVPGARTAVIPIVEGLVRAMQRIHADRHLELAVVPMAEGLAFRGEEQDLQEMLGNLLDNACKWARHRIELSAKHEYGRLTITIDDDGKGIARERRQEIVQRGARADEQVEGSGLGLAIVDELARLYEGEIRLEDSARGGVRAVLILPAAS